VTELHQDARVVAGVSAVLNYHLVACPADDKDRGPVNVFALSLRTAF
jgi:hypothetical protein